MVRSEYDFNKIVKALEGIKSRLDRNSGVKAELIYKAKDLDKVLSAGTIEQDTSIISIPGDKHVNETFAYYLENEGLVKLRVSKEGITFILTPKRHTFKKYGGFTALQKEEDDKLEKEKTRQNLWKVGGWIFAIFTPFLYKFIEFLFDRFKSLFDFYSF